MQYFISFLEGIITFISPCLLPMLPVYISYFAGDGTLQNKKSTLRNAIGFVLGFTIVFVSMGAFAGLIGASLKKNQDIVNVLGGLVLVVFGLNYVGFINISFLNNVRSKDSEKITGFVSAVLFGIIFSISWTPCVGTFLGSALVLASSQGKVSEGILMLLSYSLGLGVPFLVSAILIEELKMSMNFIKKNYKILKTISGIFLIIMGVLMGTGMMGKFLALLTFRG